MLLFGHVGVTLGVAVVLNGALTKARSLVASKPGEDPAPSAPTSPAPTYSTGIRPFSFASLGNRLDIRFLLIGSLLPDIIDKPLGQFFFRETFNNGRIFCHTLLFLFIITLAGYYLYRERRKNWLLVLSFGTLMHLIEDEMWLVPKTLMWPVYGFAFEKIDMAYWVPNMLYALFTEPSVYLPEIIGFITLVAFTVVLVRRRKIYPFIRSGQVT